MTEAVRQAILAAGGGWLPTQGFPFRFLCPGCERSLPRDQSDDVAWVEEDGRRTLRLVCKACVAEANTPATESA